MESKLTIQITNGRVFAWLFFIIAIINLFSIQDYSHRASIYLGFLIIIESIQMLLRHRNDRIYILLFGIVAYINLSILLSDCFTYGALALPTQTLVWQKYRETIYEIQLLNSLNLFISTFNVFDYTVGDNVDLKEVILTNNDNVIIFAISYTIMIYGFITGYLNASISGSYDSATSTLYEYCVLFCLFAWYYAGNSKPRHVLIWIYAVAYILRAVIYGDRSSAFPMIVMLVILYFRKMPLRRLILLTVVGIIVANIIAIYRTDYSSSGILQNYLIRYGLGNFTSDTVSQSYYTGISLAYVHSILEQPYKYFWDFFIGIFLGGNYGYANVTALGKVYATNKGGGMVVSDFYFWFGYFGPIILGFIIGNITKKFRDMTSGFGAIWKVYITVTVFRWYLYTAFDFFRGCIFVFLIVGLFFSFIDSLLKKKQINVYRS